MSLRSELFEIEELDDDGNDSFRRASNAETVAKDEEELVWAAIERLPSVEQTNLAILRRSTSRGDGDEGGGGERVCAIDVTKLDQSCRQLVVDKALDTSEQDNYKLLSGVKDRFDRAGLELPKVEVRFENLNVTAEVQTGKRALPTLINYARDKIEDLFKNLRIFRPQKHPLRILNNVSGFLKPGRMTLLLGPPGSGKTTLLLALAGELDSSLKESGSITYNGYNLNEFFVQRTSAYISQTDKHIPELTVRETLDFAARCQGASEAFAGRMRELIRLEKEKGIRPSPEIDAFMKASSVSGKKHSISTDYYLKVLGLDICADTVIGSNMSRGISGGQKKRVTSGEMIVGPKKTLFMDEISTGLDSSTTFQILKCIKNFVHLMEGTVLMALLQPAPETFELFDDLILLSEGHIVYHGPRAEVLEFFESLGFRLPPRKGVADFLQEVTFRKNQVQYWGEPSKPYRFIPVEEIAEAFRISRFGKSVSDTLSVPFQKSNCHPLALCKEKFAVPKWELFKACFFREALLFRRQSFVYIFRTFKVGFTGFVAGTTFLRTWLRPTSETYANLYLSCLFYGLGQMMYGFSELSLMISRLPVFYKQRDNCFYPAWAWSLSSWIVRIPYSILESLVWSCVVYYTVGFASSAGRFFRFMLVLFSVHQMALGLFRMIATLARDVIIASTLASVVLFAVYLSGGFILPKQLSKPWWVWSYWVSPLSYAQNAISVNEFGATRWMKTYPSENTTVGQNVLKSHDLPTDARWYWIGIGALSLYTLIFNNISTLSLAYLNPPKKAQAAVPLDISDDNGVLDGGQDQVHVSGGASSNIGRRNGMILPFQPLSMTFYNVSYFVDMPKGMKAKGVPENKLQLLSNVAGVFSPGNLTALVGSSGAGKTTLMDVLAGRKTGGYIEGDIRISGYPKEQRTFARISGYVEQNDIHSPLVTVEESLWFSSSLRLPREMSHETRKKFVDEVMKLVELDILRHALVGKPGTSGLSTEQRKRLTIGVELVANPSIIFMDEPTSGLDARAAAIVMRTVRNTVDTGRTVVCTIHQPSVDIFEAFDELLLMGRGGRVIYGGKLGVHSRIMIEYFQGIGGIPTIPDGYNPATWMLEVTTPAFEERIGQDFADIYRNSTQFREVEALMDQMKAPPPGSEPLQFDTTFSQDIISQFRLCLWKQVLVYWRCPEYNALRFFFSTLCALILGAVYWDIGSKRDSSLNLFSIMGALHTACISLGVNNACAVQPLISIERTVFYREKAAGMYSPFAYAAAQALVEIPYLAAQTLIYGFITYFMIGFERTISKFTGCVSNVLLVCRFVFTVTGREEYIRTSGTEYLASKEEHDINVVLKGKCSLYLLFMFLTFTYFTFYGMMAVGLTSSQHVASVISSFYSLWNLLSGFLIPKRFIPNWWIWFYYISPVGWTIRGLLTSQLGDVETLVINKEFRGSVKEYLEFNYGYGPGMLGITTAVLIGFNLLFAGAYMASIRFLNFQKK